MCESCSFPLKKVCCGETNDLKEVFRTVKLSFPHTKYVNTYTNLALRIPKPSLSTLPAINEKKAIFYSILKYVCYSN
jgi:hypothetical protein